MRSLRLIPSLLVKNSGCYQSEKFKRYTYVGDPINTIRLFNDLCVDELVILDLTATTSKRGPDIEFIKQLAAEAFVPLAYGGGIRSLTEANRIIQAGVEKIVINSAAIENLDIIKGLSDQLGSQSVVVCVDVKKTLFGKYKVYDYRSKSTIDTSLAEYLELLQAKGAGELLIQSVDLNGSLSGCDETLISRITSAVLIPVVYAGGINSLQDIKSAYNAGADAIAASSFFVFHGKQKGILINYPEESELENLFA